MKETKVNSDKIEYVSPELEIIGLETADILTSGEKYDNDFDASDLNVFD